MSFDDYANHIYQKHRLAVALGIIKSKPPNITTAKYLEELKSKFDDKMDDDDIIVCSDDFLIDDDDDEINNSVTILKDFDHEDFRNENRQHFSDVTNDIYYNAAREKTLPLPEDLTQTTFYDSSQTHFITPNIANPFPDNTAIYEENHNDNHILDVEQAKAKNVVNKIDDYNSEKIISDHNTPINKKYTNNMNVFSEKVSVNRDFNHNPVEYKSNLANTDATYYDSQKTILYTVHGFTDNYTHYSASQNDVIIPNKYIYGVNRTKNEAMVQNMDKNGENNTKKNNEFGDETQFESDGNHIENILNSKTYEKPSSNEDFGYSQTMKIFSQSNESNLDRIQNKISNENLHSSSEKDFLNRHTENTNIHNSTQYNQNVEEYIEEMQTVDENIFTNSFLTRQNNTNEHVQYTDMEITNEIFEHTPYVDIFSQNIESSHSQNEFDKGKKIHDTNNITTKEISKENDETIIRNTENSENNYQLVTISDKNDFPHENHEKIAEDECDSQEMISYKILEEFNKVKTFLNRQNRRMSCDGYSTDSGYRSDSQIRSSNRSALQLSGNWLNQSGCCLFNYIMQCPLVAATRDITDEIAEVLSQLIDRLHEEEKYPSFLEDVLETVDLLLRQVYEGDSSGESEFLKKDETIQRILLLNKSIHIQKHTIEKISNILEAFHSKVTEIDSTYELSNIEHIENISYIFHILEILLKKYLKNRDLLSQSSTQLSQDEEKIFKKSSITDIWRKKWNPSQKVFEGSHEKKCVIKLCSEILNRIVVECVNSYSLVAYSALKCFNCMQS